MKIRSWYDFRASATAGPAEIWIYDEIGAWGVPAQAFLENLAKYQGQAVKIRLNSPGGVVADALAIYNGLKRHRGVVTIHIDGLAASCASYVAMAGDRVLMAENALMMVHKPWLSLQGNATDLRQSAAVLDKWELAIVSGYQSRFKGTDAELNTMLEGETWLDAEEALAWGFVDEIEASVAVAACFDLSRFQKLPDTAFTRAMKDKAIIQNLTITERNRNMPTVEEIQARASEISTLCHVHGCADKAADWIREGLTVDQVSGKIIAMTASAPFRTPAAEHLDGFRLTPADERRYSMRGAIAQAAGVEPSGFESEVSQTLAKSLGKTPKQNGVLVPLNLAMNTPRGAMTSQTATSGAEFVFTVPGEFIDLLRARTLVRQLGARNFSGLRGPVGFPKQTAPATLYWMGENPSDPVPDTAQGTDVVTLTPKTAMGATNYSRQLLTQSSPDVETFVRSDLAGITAEGIDKVSVQGTGSNNQPKGLLLQTGVHVVTKAGSVVAWEDVVELEAAVATSNADQGALGFLCSPTTRKLLRKTPELGTTFPQWIWKPDAQGRPGFGNIAGYVAGCSTNCPDTHLLYGDWSSLMIGEFGALEIIADPYTLARKGLIAITSFAMIDVAVRHGESFAKLAL